MADTATAETTTETTTTEAAPTLDQWRDHLPPEIKDHPSFKDLADVGAMATKLVHAEAMVGKDRVVVPGKDATDDERSVFFNRLGRPDDVEGYEIPKENMPEGFTADKAVLQGPLEEFHRIGLNKQQVAAIIRLDANRSHEASEALLAAVEETKKESEVQLRKDFGKAFDQNMEQAHNAIDEFGGKELREKLNASGWGNDPAMIHAWAKVGKALAEDEVIGGGGKQTFAKSPAQANAEMEALKLDPAFMKNLTKAHEPGHLAAKAQWEKLQAEAFATEERAPLV